MSRLVLKTPIDGVVLHRSIQPGEVATPGAPLMTVADVHNLELTIYLRTTDIGVVQVGQEVAITSESLPGQEFRGQVASIATKAEFTPKNVQTQRDRLGLVYAVKVSIRSDGRLKPGLPVDARVLAG
jgi:HlyD family secretion protein